ncbi:MAG TPA: TetR/AcrR family transcriptional regulator [Phycicoccus sp.]
MDAKVTGGVRARRREETRRRILDAAWALSAESGLTGWSLRELGAAVGLRAPSLYGYAASKNDLFDLMFADGYRQLLRQVDELPVRDEPVDRLRDVAREFVRFAMAEPARFQLLFQYSAPGFAPSEESMGLARRVLDDGARALADAGVTDPADVDLWTAVLTGLASQQVANDPGGDRWLRLVDAAVARFLGSDQAVSLAAATTSPRAASASSRTRAKSSSV